MKNIWENDVIRKNPRIYRIKLSRGFAFMLKDLGLKSADSSLKTNMYFEKRMYESLKTINIISK